MKLVHCFLYLLLFTSSARAEVKLPKLVSNGMVLQRNQSIKIWGWADVGEVISLTFKNKTYTTKTGIDHRWVVKIEPQQAGGPFKMLINKIELQDLLIGDVWLCAGQSNMEALMSRPNIKANYAQVIENSNFPQIRQFTVKRDMAFNPIADVMSDKGWVAANPTTVLDFSAVAYFFAKELYQKYKVPIGIINSSVGGTPIQSWVNSESLKHFPEYDAVAQKLKDTTEIAQILKAHQLKTDTWYKSIKEEGLVSTTASREADWQEISGLEKFDQQFKSLKYGTMWFKTQINIPQHLAGKAAKLSLGMMHTEDETYLNGQKIGGINSGYTERNYAIGAGLLKTGENNITIRLISPTTGISFNAKNRYQIKFDTDSIALNNPWKFKTGIEKELLPRGNGLSAHSPTAYYYAMIKPLSDYNVKGIVWYQGESNTAKPEEYKDLLSALINLWRKDWQKADLPFLYVQLANYLGTTLEPETSNWALLREAQMRTLKLPYTAMVVTHDIGEKGDIHPRNKLDVGKRLALAAQNITGPIYQSIKISGNQVFVTFDHVGTGLTYTGKSLNGFSLSADSKNFTSAKAKIVGKQVLVWHPSIAKPIALRYAWADSPDGANLYNKEGLPASSFKSN